MPEVHFTAWLRELVPDGPVEARGRTVAEVLDAVFARQPQLRSYVLDERGRLRKHVCVFADGRRLPNGGALAQPVGEGAKIHVMQALSGG